MTINYPHFPSPIGRHPHVALYMHTLYTKAMNIFTKKKLYREIITSLRTIARNDEKNMIF